MNQRERYRETLLFGKPDKVPFSPGGPRESTLKVWHQQGLPEGVNYMETLLKILGIEREWVGCVVSDDPDFRREDSGA